MKKFIVVLLLCTVTLAGCSAEQLKPKNEVDYASELQEASEGTNTCVDLQSHEFVFKEVYREKAGGTEVVGTEVIRLYLDESRYYPIIFPNDVEFVTDYSKYIYAKDGSASISVLSNVSADDLSKFAVVDEAESVSKNMIVTSPDSKSQKREAAIYLAGNKAIVMRTYNNLDVYKTVLNGMILNQNAIVKDVTFDVSNASTSIPDYSKAGYRITVMPGLGDNIQKFYSYDSGSLTVSRELRRYDVAMDELATKIALVSDSINADVYYNDNKRCYFEVGDYFAAAYSVNFNTTLTCFGYGDEAKYNAIVFLNSQGGD